MRTFSPCSRIDVYKRQILRYGSLYGPRADRRNAINRFVAEALEKGTITYYGAPTALRLSLIHI